MKHAATMVLMRCVETIPWRLPLKRFLPSASNGSPEGLRMAEETARWVAEAHGATTTDSRTAEGRKHTN